MTQDQMLAEATTKYKIGTIFCTPSTCWGSYPKGDYKVTGNYCVESRGVYCNTDKGAVWIFFQNEWGETLLTQEQKVNLEMKGIYRERLKKLTDENIELRHENQQLKQLLAQKSNEITC